MALTVVSGIPGHGKTLYALFRWRKLAEAEKRPVFYSGIKGLKIQGWQEWPVEQWEKLPAGAIFLIDEAWDHVGTFGRGMIPGWVQELARHRHLGIDVVLITQDPMQLDPFVRRLVDQHFHIVRKFGTHWATIHEFVNGVRDNVAKSRKGSIRHEWRYPKEVFTWYESAEQHTMKVRLPARLWLLLLGPLMLLGGGWYGWQSLHRQPDQQGQRSSQAQGVSGGPGGQTASGNRQRVKTAIEYAEDYVPRVQGLPHTAPVYDDVTKPTDAPYPAACISMPAKHRCSCYTQQGTKLDTGAELCEQIAAGGFFVSWAQRVAQAVPIQPGQAVRALEPVPTGAMTLGSGQVAQAAPAAGQVEQDPTRPRVRR